MPTSYWIQIDFYTLKMFLSPTKPINIWMIIVPKPSKTCKRITERNWAWRTTREDLATS